MGKMEAILENKKKEIREFKETHGERVFSGGELRPSFKNAIKLDGLLSIIGEVKRKSPSEGDMAMKEDPAAIAKIYSDSGVNAISVLTDEKFFGGSFGFLKEISSSVKVPTLCKDFILDSIQLDLAKLSGASAALLITDILDDISLKSLYYYAKSIGIEALVEAHTPENIRRAVDLGVEIIGINNRNLFTLAEDLNHSIKHIHLIPDSIVKVSLSSVRERKDLIKIAEAGFDSALLGTVLMRAFNKKAAIKSFKDVPKHGAGQLPQTGGLALGCS